MFNFSSVLLLTGIGHILNLCFFPILTLFASKSEVVSIAKIDGGLALMISIVGFGLNASTSRDVALLKDPTPVIESTQSSKITLSLLLSLLGAIWISINGFDEFAFAALFAPILALGYENVLYGLGKPVLAAVASFIRQSIPLLILLALALIGVVSWEVYSFFILLFYVVAAAFVAKLCQARLFYGVRQDFFFDYLDAFYIGLAGIFLVFLRLGYLNFLPENVSEETKIQLVFFTKICLFAVAAKRIIIQYLFKKISAGIHNSKINTMIFSLGFLSSFTCLATPYILRFINVDTTIDDTTFYYSALGCFGIMMSGVADSELLFLKKDKIFMFSHAVPVVCATLLFFVYRQANIFWILIGCEFLVSVCLLSFCFFYRRMVSV